MILPRGACGRALDFGDLGFQCYLGFEFMFSSGMACDMCLVFRFIPPCFLEMGARAIEESWAQPEVVLAVDSPAVLPQPSQKRRRLSCKQAG